MKVLVAVDLRSDSADVVPRAIPWIVRLGAIADLVYADTWREPLEQHLPFAARGDLEAMVAEDQKALDALAEQIPATNRGRAAIVPGLPGEVIAKLAPDYDAVIVSTHGRKGFAHLWLGSVAERIVRTCPKSVLVVRNPPPEGPGRVLFSVALEDGQAQPTLEAVARWVGRGRIDLLHVDEMFGREMPETLPYMVGPKAADIILTEAANRRSLAETHLARMRDEHLAAESRGDVYVSVGPPAQAILENAEHYDLLVLGTHGRTGLAHTVFGSVAERVVQRSPRTVLILRT